MKCPAKPVIDPAVIANLKCQIRSHRTSVQADVEAQQSMVAYAESRTSHLNRNITIMLLVAVFFGIAMRFNYWII